MYYILAYLGYIPMMILQIYMSVIIFPIAICGYIIWKYRQKSKKVVKINILFHVSGLISYICTKIRTTRFLDLDSQIENTLTLVELVLVILFAVFGIALIIEIIKYKKEEEKTSGKEKKKFLSIGKLEDLKSPFVLSKIAIFLIIFGFVMGLTYMENFMGSTYELADTDDEPYTLYFTGLSISWMDSTGNDSFCEEATYTYNPLTRSIDVYCFMIYDKTIKIKEATPEKFVIIDPWTGELEHFVERGATPKPENNPDYLVGRKFETPGGAIYYFKSKTQVEMEHNDEKYLHDYLFADFGDNDFEIIIRNNKKFNYDKSKDKIQGLKEIK